MVGRSKTLQITATTINVIIFIFLLVINFYASRPNEGPFKHLFGNYSTGDVSDKFYIEITPAGWAFSIWGLIYTWQASWIIYSLTLLCRSDNFQVISPVLLFIFTLTSVVNVTWSVLWSRLMIQSCSILLFAISFLLYGALTKSFMTVNVTTKTVSKRDFILTQVLVNNGLGMYATWTTIASLLNMTMAISYFHGVAQDVGCTIALSILAVELIVWFALENTILDKYTRYTLTVYPVVIWALSASISKNWDAAKRNSVISVVLLAVACTLLVVRIVIAVWRATKTTNRRLENGSILLRNSWIPRTNIRTYAASILFPFSCDIFGHLFEKLHF